MRLKTENLEGLSQGPHYAETSDNRNTNNNSSDENVNNLVTFSRDSEIDMLPDYEDFINLLDEINKMEGFEPNLNDDVENDQNNAKYNTGTDDISNYYNNENNNDTSSFDNSDIDAIVEKRFDEIIVENENHIKDLLNEQGYVELNTENAIYSEEKNAKAIGKVEEENNDFEKTPASDGFVERRDHTDYGQISDYSWATEITNEAPDDSFLNTDKFKMEELQSTASIVHIEIIKIPQEYGNDSLSELLDFHKKDSVELLKGNDNVNFNKKVIKKEKNKKVKRKQTQKSSKKETKAENSINDKKSKDSTNIFKCDACGGEFTQKCNLKRHIVAQHIRKFLKCSECEFATTHKHKLDVHRRRHTGEKPFACDKCDYAASRKYTLKTHYSRHFDEKPFSCEMCNANFRILKYLKRHQRYHCPSKKHICEYCSMKFNLRTCLIEHLKMHGEYVCELCGEKFKTIYLLNEHEEAFHGKSCKPEYSISISFLKPDDQKA